jgi:hypothetical protein
LDVDYRKRVARDKRAPETKLWTGLQQQLGKRNIALRNRSGIELELVVLFS